MAHLRRLLQLHARRGRRRGQNHLHAWRAGPELEQLSQITELPRPTEIPEDGLLCDLLWSDPTLDPRLGLQLARRELHVWTRRHPRVP